MLVGDATNLVSAPSVADAVVPATVSTNVQTGASEGDGSKVGDLALMLSIVSSLAMLFRR